MATTKRIFFKTVRSNGDSVWAIGRFNRNYQIGKRYRFSKEFPAYVFIAHQDKVDSEEIYASRAEPLGGNRVLICYGNFEERDVPRYNIEDNWNLNHPAPKMLRYVSTDFVVIGEVKPQKADLREDAKFKRKVINQHKTNQ